MVAVATVLAVVVVVVAATVGSVLLAAGRAQDAADAAALAAAHATAQTVDPTTAAATAAAAHGATLLRCDCSGGEVEVTVRVEVSARPARLLGFTDRTSSARARLVATVSGLFQHEVINASEELML